jgi:hypothetical protein
MNIQWLTNRFEMLNRLNHPAKEAIGWFLASGEKAIGFETGQLRPGELGQWDLYYFLLQAGFGPPKEAAFVAGLDLETIKKEESKEY